MLWVFMKHKELGPGVYGGGGPENLVGSWSCELSPTTVGPPRDGCDSSHSMFRITLMISAVVVALRSRGSPGSEATMTSGDVRYFFGSSKAFSASSVQTKGLAFSRSLKNGSVCLPNLKINRMRAGRQPVCNAKKNRKRLRS
jgi:hypothetical protein